MSNNNQINLLIGATSLVSFLGVNVARQTFDAHLFALNGK